MAHELPGCRSRLFAGFVMVLALGALAAGRGTIVAARHPQPAPRDATLMLRIVDAETGQPVAAAQVERWNSDAVRLYEPVGETGADGLLAIPVTTPTNFLRLRVRADGHRSTEVSWESARRGDLEDWPMRDLQRSYTLQLPPGVRIGGVVQDEAGRPAPNAYVKFTPFSSGEATGQDLEAQRPPAAAPEEVEAWPRLNDDHSARWIRADEQGRWSWSNVHRIDRVSVVAFTDDHTPVYPAASEQELLAGNAVLKVKPGVRIAGIVTDAQGRPVAGARVWADAGEAAGCSRSWDEWTAVRPGGCMCGIVADTDEQGRYALAAITPQVVAVYAAAPGHGPGSGYVNASASQVGERAPLDIQLTPATTLAGRVVDPQGQPIAGAYIAIDTWRQDSEAISARTRSDAGGIFHFDNLPPEPVTFEVSARGYQYRYDVVLTPGAQPDARITLQPQMRLRGSVTDARTGQPVPAFRVVPGYALWPDRPPMFQYQNEMPVFIDGNYDFKLYGNPGSHKTVARIEAAGYRPAVSGALAAAEVVFDVRLEPAAPITGVVTGLGGRPVAGAQVVVALPGHQVSVYDGQTGVGGVSASATDEAGRFSLPPQTGPFELLVLHDEGYAQLALEGEAIAADQATDVKLAPWAIIEGSFDLPGTDGGRAKGFSIYANPHRDRADPAALIQWRGAASVSEDGTYRFARFPDFGGLPVLVSFNVTTRDYSVSLPLRLASAQALRVDVVEGGAGARTLAGRLELDGGGQPSGGWSSLIVAPAELAPPAELPQDPRQAVALAKPTYSVVPGADGTFRIPAVAPGRYSLIGSIALERERVLSGSKTIEVADGAGELDVGAIPVTEMPAEADQVRVPDVLAQRLPDGAPIRREDLRGRHTLVLLFHSLDSRAAARLEELPALTEALAPLAGDGRLLLLAVSLDRAYSIEPQRPQLPAPAAEAPWRQAYIDYAQQDHTRRLGMRQSPWLLLIDPTGNVAWFGGDLREALTRTRAAVQAE